ncbi:hypothetical protein [Paenibacillus paeoniae]|uniref:SMI1/KNR4 family protein n=1 Tax=Paenibacillus paeoniae TaxID=2292705 RepID=A0A371PN68_9BACL|nr:hypothetical protein [Paenibacillus paeoniae]REK77664.1 hypothetical protein DX130_11910 [Paenibacillus paeoniae]
MKLNELQNKLLELSIPENAYSLSGGLPNETICIDESNGKWVTYYSERGNKTGYKVFDNEEEACNYFLGWIKRNFA